MSMRDLAIIELLTGVALLVGEDMKYVYELAEELTGHVVLTHQLSDIADQYHDQLVNMYSEIYTKIKLSETFGRKGTENEGN